MEEEIEDCPVKLSFEDLQKYTDDFSQENYIGEFQFGKVYHGRIPVEFGCDQQPKPVTVKVWEIPTRYPYYEDDHLNRLMDEVLFLQQERFTHPGLMKLYGYCSDYDHWAMVYDFKSYNTVHNLLLSDDFKWWQRIKVALGLAHLLKFLHVEEPENQPLMIRNIDAAHVMVDEDFNPKLYDFSMITGGMFPDKRLFPVYQAYGSFGYIEPSFHVRFVWSSYSDVFAFGTILLGLMTKKFYTEEDRLACAPNVGARALEEYGSDDSRKGVKKSKTSLVLKCFEGDPWFCASDGAKITRLAIRCVRFDYLDRPTMKEVVIRLQKLQIVRLHPDIYSKIN